jgi:hypothetical protein
MPVIRQITCLILFGWAQQVLAQAADSTEDIRGAKHLVEIPQPQQLPIALWLSVAAGVLLVALVIWLWLRKCRNRRQRSPREVALDALAELEHGGEAMAAEPFANRAADVVRQYIAGRFGLAAPRRTTEEFFRELVATNQSPLLVGEGDSLRGFLKTCDLAKFAAASLDARQRGEMVSAARGFVAATSAAEPNKKP